jgi:uncharacterized protein YecT (DUF1311 family)
MRMKKMILFISSCFLASNAFAAKINCTDPQATPEINYCAEQTYQAADKLLNANYKKLVATLTDNAEKERLVNAQRAWVSFRDKHCEFETYPMRQGTGYSGYLSACLEELTKSRAEILKKSLDR